MRKNMNIIARDDRVTEYLLPSKILRKRGQIENESAILRGKTVPIQICVNEPDSMIMTSDSGNTAEVLLDFGVEFNGGVRILAEKCPENAKLRLTFGESAAEALSELGFKNATNHHAPRQFIAELSKYSDQTFGQTGFRFLRLELIGECSVRIPAILGAFTFRDIPYRGSFCCNDELLNQIYDTCAYTCHLNMQEMLWDGIKRDRLVWIGDMHPEMLSIRTVFGPDRCVLDGLEYAVQTSPLPNYSNGMVTYSMWWLIILRDWLKYCGTADYASVRKDYISSLSRQLCDYIDENGADSFTEQEYFLDWTSFKKPGARGGVRALLSISLRAAAELCTQNGDTETAELCALKASAIDSAPVPLPDEKQALALMLLAGHAESEQVIPRLLEGGARGMSTFMSYYILTALANSGEFTEAVNILKEYYGGMLKAGATTFWEDFDISWIKNGETIDHIPEPGEYDIHGDNGIHCYVGYRHSFCHGWASAPTAFLAEQALGVRILEPGCALVSIQPQLGDLQWVKGTYPTPHGDIRIQHQRLPDGSVDSEVVLPTGVKLAENI